MLIAPLIADRPELSRARDLANSFLATAPQYDAEARFPASHIGALAQAGLLGLAAPEHSGGAGLGLERLTAVVGEIARGCPATALILTMQYAHLATLHRGRWAPELVARVTEGAVKRGELINALRVEPELGTPMRGGLPATTARRVADGWVLSGRKIYSTGSEGLTWGSVWARTDEDAPRVGQFLVPLGAKGVRIEPSWNTLGLRASSSHDVVFEDVWLPADYAADLRAPQDWAARADDSAAWSTLMIAALYTGVAEAARDWLVAFLRNRVPSGLGHPLSQLPRVQEALGAIEEKLRMNRRLILSATRDIDEGRALPLGEVALVKNTATENAIRATEEALKLCGNHAISRNNPLERHYRDVLCGRIHSPQEDSTRISAGRLALGL